MFKKYTGYLARELKPKGQILVLTALLLPLMLASAGLAIDFGNMYIHKAKLQNAADAAALAGGHRYLDSLFSDLSNGTVNSFDDSKDLADSKANELLKANLYSDTLAEYSITKQSARSSSDKTLLYYRVVVSEEVSLSFLKYFLDADAATVSAAGYAKIQLPQVSGITATDNANFSSLFSHIISYGSSYLSIPDYNSNYKSSFSGTIARYNSSGYIRYYQSRNRSYSYNTTSSNYSLSSTDANGNLDVVLADIAKKISIFANLYGNTSYLSTYSNSDNRFRVATNNRFDINGDLSNGDAKPFYWITTTNTSDSNVRYIRLDTSMTRTGRPYIYLHFGSGSVTLSSTVTSGVFHGIIYAPYATVNVNMKGGTIYGAIVAKGVNMVDTSRSNYYYNTFNYQDIMEYESTESLSDYITDINKKVSLSDDGGIDWSSVK